jgi:tripartite-type tricarboxylate transporter receptor subunit TctC
MNVRRVMTVFCAAAVAAAAPATAQTFPQHPIRWLSPFAPGGGADTTTRAVAQKVSEYVAQPVVVDSRTGASGKIAVDLAARAPADGHTLITITPSMVSNQDIAAFVPITQMTAQFYVLVVNPSVAAGSVKELIALARAKPGALHYGSAGVETMQHLAGASLGAMTGTTLMHVPYKGGAQALTDLLGGQIQFMFAAVPTALPHVKSGRVRALAVSGARRSPLMPDVLTVAEAGVPGFEVDNWYGIAAPPKTPRGIVSRLNAEAVRALRASEVRDRIIADGNEPVGNSIEEFVTVIRETIQRWRKAEKAARVRS